MPLPCETKCGRNAVMKRPKTGAALCQPCFFQVFEDEVHETIRKGTLFQRGDYVAIAASGGKDSTVLAYVLKLLNERHNYGLKLVLLSVDEGITGYRDDSLETVKRNEIQYELPLKILSYKELYGWTMDEIVREVGRKNNCTFCGVFRRQALDRGAMMLGVRKIVTGHNADDVAETILMNLLRGDVARLQRCTAITTGAEGALPRSKPFKYTYEKEIVMYAYYKKLDYFSTECSYSPNAYRGHVRTLIKDLERIRPSSIIDIIHSGESLSIKEGVKMPTQGVCEKCHYISSQTVCKACVMLEGLNKGLPKLGIGKSSKVKGKLRTLNNNEGGEGKCGGGGCGGGSCGKNDEGSCSSAVEENRPVRAGRRSATKQSKAKERKAKLLLNDETSIQDQENSNLVQFLPANSVVTGTNGENTDGEGLGEFFGCGGFSEFPGEQPLPDLEDDDVGTLQSNVRISEIDIENLSQLASTLLHVGGRSTNS